MTGLDAAEGRRLLAVARAAIAERLAGGDPPAFPPGEPALAAFVTLRRREDGELRGCIGHVEARHPTSEAVARAAVAAACSDPRFPPVTAEELPGLRLEVSLLLPARPARPEEVEPGRHGVIATWEGGRGLLLPQVAAEHGWDRETLLDHVCLKAGAPRDAWRDGRATLAVFTATVFEEGE